MNECPKCGAAPEYVDKMGCELFVCGSNFHPDRPTERVGQTWQCKAREAQAALARERRVIRLLAAEIFAAAARDVRERDEDAYIKWAESEADKQSGD